MCFEGTGKKLTYMDHEGIVQVITESDHEKMNSVVHAKAAKPSKSRECCWLVLQNNGDLITCSKDGAVLSSTCDHYGLLRAPEPNKVLVESHVATLTGTEYWSRQRVATAIVIMCAHIISLLLL